MNSNLTEPAAIRKFGFIAFLFFGSLCALGVWTQKPLPTYLFGCLTALGMAFMALPAKLTPVYLRWMQAAQFLGKAFTALILTLAYFLVITPAGFLKRIFGGTPLSTKPDKKLPSYWVARTEPAQPLARFIKRF